MFGKNIYSDEIPNFPDLPEDYFDIKDEQTIKELTELHQSYKEIIPVQGKITNEFRMRQKQLLNVFDTLENNLKSQQEKPDLFEPNTIEYQVSTPFKNFDYYNLSQIEYDQVQAIQEANKYLTKNQNEINQKFGEMQLESKPKPLNSNHKQNLTRRMELLSFQGDDEQ